eukprot:TRINITY_DN6682_c0_g1_i1.p1 TRINITY_DN6682_c0_g1~~TRINITY_DN6682_c0_g1_i1.p1  ORF type:complete len:276 (-),score=56.82 TRINITY_DN6682_c0_g1_i1:159-986(-)
MWDPIMSYQEIVDNEFIEAMKNINIIPEKVVIITIQRSHSGDFCSLIINFEKEELEECYPATDFDYKDLFLNNCSVCFTQLESMPEIDLSNNDNNSDEVFCCDQLKLYKNRRTTKDEEFKNFIKSTGSSSYIFHMKKQINFGKIIFEKYFSLKDGIISEVDGDKLSKVHTFKNYKCQNHNMFYGIDLYSKSKSVYNKHHMRIYPYQNINMEVLDLFKRDALKKKKSTNIDISSLSLDNEPTYNDYYSSSDYSSNLNALDFNACDSQCGYCGQCDY